MYWFEDYSPLSEFIKIKLLQLVYFLKKLINATLGNKVLDVLFSSIISFYLHLYNVEQNRKLLNSLKYDAFDEESKINKHFSILKNLS